MNKISLTMSERRLIVGKKRDSMAKESMKRAPEVKTLGEESSGQLSAAAKPGPNLAAL